VSAFSPGRVGQGRLGFPQVESGEGEGEGEEGKSSLIYRVVKHASSVPTFAVCIHRPFSLLPGAWVIYMYVGACLV